MALLKEWISKIETIGDVNAIANSKVDLFAKTQFNVLGTLEIGDNVEFTIAIEDCDEN